jgi:hypothetical protein
LNPCLQDENLKGQNVSGDQSEGCNSERAAPSSSPSSEVSEAANPASEPVTDDPKLAKLVEAWPTLPAAVRDRILGMVDAAQAMSEGNSGGESGE